MPAFDHEGPRDHQVGHLRIIERLAQVPVRHFPFDGPHEAEGLIRRGHFRGPLVEVARTDRQTVFLQDRRHADRRLAAVAQAVERDALAVDKGQRVQPAQDLVVLRDDERESVAWIVLALRLSQR